MSYSYQAERPKLFTEDGVALLTRIRDRAKELLRIAGAFRQAELLSGPGISGDSWTQMACVDYLVEKGEIVELPRNCWGQFRVFSTPQVHNHG